MYTFICGPFIFYPTQNLLTEPPPFPCPHCQPPNHHPLLTSLIANHCHQSPISSFFFLSKFYLFSYLLYICLGDEKTWKSSRKYIFDSIFMNEKKKTLENIFQTIFKNSTKQLKIFSFSKIFSPVEPNVALI